MGTDGVECLRIPYRTTDSIQRPAFKGECHKRFIRAGERCRYAEFPCDREAKSRVIRGVPNDNDNTVAEAQTFLEPLFNERGPDPKALEILVHC